MAQFSIKEAVKFSFAAYGKHLVLLLTASALVGASLWFATVAPRYVSQKLGIEHHLIRQDSNAAGISYDEAKADPSTITQRGTEGIVGRVFARPLESAALLLVTLFVWVLFLFLLLGCMKLGLSFVDRDSGSLRLMFQISARQMMRFIGVSLFFIATSFGVCGVARAFEMFVMGPVGAVVHAYSVIAMALVLIVVLPYWLLVYLFSVYGIADMLIQGVRDAVKKSSSIVWGSYGRLVLAVLLFSLLAGAVCYLVNMLVIMSGVVGVMGEKQEITRFTCALLTTPFSIPYFSYIYRALTRKA